MKLQKYFKLFIHVCLACCGTVALVVLGKLANIRKLAKDLSYGSAASGGIFENLNLQERHLRFIQFIKP
jgi:hypothetical protein